MGQAVELHARFRPGVRIGIVRALFNESITQALLDGCRERLLELGCQATNIVVSEVPGAYEIPLACSWLLADTENQTGVDAVIGLGTIIRGGTPHFDYVCDAVTQGCTRLQLDTQKPVVFGVLTCDTLQQAWERTGGIVGHKGKEGAEVAAFMLKLKEQNT